MSRRSWGPVLLVTSLLVLGSACSADAKSKQRPCKPDAAPRVIWASCKAPSNDLRGVNLSAAVLSSVDFTNVDLTGASLAGANINKVEFENAKLTDVDLTGATISGGDIQKGKFCRTKMPDGKIASADC